jgi:hypothetical protein
MYSLYAPLYKDTYKNIVFVAISFLEHISAQRNKTEWIGIKERIKINGKINVRSN